MNSKYLVLFTYGDCLFYPCSNLQEAEAYAFNLLKNQIQYFILERTDKTNWRLVE